MVNLVDFLIENISFEHGTEVAAIMLGILFMIVYDFYHYLISAVLSWFKK